MSYKVCVRKMHGQKLHTTRGFGLSNCTKEENMLHANYHL